MALELVTYADLKNLLGLEQSAITDYPALNVLRDSVVAAIENYLGRLLESAERTETIFVYETPRKMIKLKALPITSFDSVAFGDWSGEESEYSSDTYRRTAYGIELYVPVSDGYIAVTYTGGWVASDVPDDIKRAALLQTAYEFQGKDYIGSESVSNEGGTVTRPAIGLLDEVKRLLNPYKHPLKTN